MRGEITFAADGAERTFADVELVPLLIEGVSLLGVVTPDRVYVLSQDDEFFGEAEGMGFLSLASVRM